MDKAEATRALEILRSVVKQARDDSALQNWGVIWMVHGVMNGAAFVATNLLLWRGHDERWPYVTLWSAVVAFNLVSIVALKTRTAGARSFVENQMWAIWLTFIGAVMTLALVNDLMGQRIFGLGPIIGILSAVGFSSMGALMGRRWYLGTAIFGATAIGMALAPSWQFVILGVIWGAAQVAGGVWLHLEKRRRLALAPDAPRLV